MLRYLIVNSVHSLKAFLTTNQKEYIDFNLETDKFDKIREYSIFLSHLLDILFLLLQNLLSSHVDNYRDDLVIENIVELILVLINTLYDFLNKNDFSYKTSMLTEIIQILFEKALFTLKEISKFNTTIKLNFERILEKISERPNFKGGMLFILNFLFNVVNNDYTIETFLEIIKKTQTNPKVDCYYNLETINNQIVKIGHFADKKNFIDYLVDVAINTNNEWISLNAAKLLTSINRASSVKGRDRIYEKVVESVMDSFNKSLNNVNKVDINILQEKEIENFIPTLDVLYRTLRFVVQLLRTEYKFLFIFHDITLSYTQLFKKLYEYVYKVVISQEYFSSNFEFFNVFLENNQTKKLKAKVFEMIELVIESLSVLMDNKKGFYETSNFFV